MAPDARPDVWADLLIGIFSIGFGLYFTRQRANRERRKKSLSRKYGIDLVEINALLRPLDGSLFNALNIWTAWAIVFVGLSRLAALAPVANVQYYSMALMVFAIGQIFFAGGLQLIFTAKAYSYNRRLIWTNPRDLPRGFLGPLEIVWGRVFGFVPLCIGGLIIYSFLGEGLKILGLIKHFWLPWGEM